MADADRAPDALTEAVRRKLRITWKDDVTDARIEQDIVPAARATISERLGLPEGFDLGKPSPERMLVEALAFYLWNDAEDEFWPNYEREVVTLRRKWEVTSYAQAEKASSALP